MNTSLFSNTPTVTVLDNRGLTVRDIAYHSHPDTPEVTSGRITRHRYDARGFLTQSAEPRLHAAGLANFSYLTDLAGSVLRTVSVDAGTTVALNDAAGRPFIAVSNIGTADDGTEDLSQAVTRTWQYEDAALPGRALSITEQLTGKAARITERFVYAGHTAGEKALNLAGADVSHYDTAGLTQTDSIALTGSPLSVTRRLLKDADNPDVVADWQGGEATVWNTLLGDKVFTTLTTADATGAVLTTTDAQGNVQRVAYDVAGLLSGSWLTLKDGTEQVIVASLTYSAAGQKLREEHGSGVVTTYTYEPETQRLTGIKTARPAGHPSGAKVLQDLRYEYDPAGNVLKITNDAEETRFWRNQKVVPENTYTYDSLYQLVSAIGREMASAGQQCNSLPSVTVPLPTDGSAYTNYTRTYSYDEAGNLTQVRHCAPATGNNYTTDITVSSRSNRGVQSTLTDNPADVDALFTAGGQQKQLQPGQSLIWTPRNELQTVTPVVRDGAAADYESYRYDAGSQRVLKMSVQETKASTQRQRALYLPRLELRSTKAGDTVTENLHVVTVGEAGRAQVRVLHWTSGRPESISNDRVRYSYDNLTGSSGLELDGDGNVISAEEYYPYGGTAILAARSVVEADYKTVRYSGKERDATGLYYYGYRYYQPWAGRWLSADPAGTIDGLNLFRMVRNNPVTLRDADGLAPAELYVGLLIAVAAIAYILFGYRTGQLQSISNPRKITTWTPESINSDYITTHMVRGNDSDFYQKSAEAVLASRDIFSASLINTKDVKKTHEGRGYRYTGAYAQSGFIIELPPQNIIATHEHDISFPTHIGKQGRSGEVSSTYKLADVITRPPIAGYSFTGKPLPRISSYINMLSPDELLDRKNEAEKLLPDRTLYRNEILAIGKSNVNVHEGFPPTEGVKVKGILVASDYADGRITNEVHAKVKRLQKANPDLPVYTLGNKKLELASSKLKRH
ncbi:RHS repeat domain-containing protein [Escherichia sp. E1130]|uniref:RHS repeat domain-containing protein n=1 Tax=Escherichia sp. E1130 TaxID=2041645 RepID=UPI00269DC217